MKRENIHNSISFKKFFWLLAGLATGIQIIVIIYNHLSGYHILPGWEYFVLRLIRGVILSLPAAFLLAYPDLFMIGYLNRKSPWGKYPLRRIPLQLLFSIMVAITVSILFTSFANWLRPYHEDLKGVYVNNILIFVVVNVFLMSILRRGSTSRKANWPVTGLNTSRKNFHRSGLRY